MFITLNFSVLEDFFFFFFKLNLGLVSSRGSGYSIHLHLTDFNWTFQSNVQASYSATETVKYQLSGPVMSGLFLVFFIFSCILFHASHFVVPP